MNEKEKCHRVSIGVQFSVAATYHLSIMETSMWPAEGAKRQYNLEGLRIAEPRNRVFVPPDIVRALVLTAGKRVKQTDSAS